jgi:hypothetical protein
MKNLKLKLVIAFTVINTMVLCAQGSTGVLKGQIVNNEKEPVIGATIKITSGGILIGGTTTNEEGKYTYKPLNAGFYEVIVQSFETETKQVNNVVVNPEKTTYVDVTVSPNTLGEVIVQEEYKKPVIDNSYVTMRSIDSDTYLHSSNDRMDIKAMLVSVSSDISVDDNGGLHVRGSRGDATAYIIDGVRTEHVSGIGALSVENLSVITGGVPAQYGDLTSGVVVVTTKDYFSGIRAKHMRENNNMEKQARIKREEHAQQEEEHRKKEIEEELRLEQESKTNKG